MKNWAQLVAAIVIAAISIVMLIVRNGDDDAVLTKAAEALSAQTSYRTSFSIETKAQASFVVEFSGIVDQRTKLGRMTMHFRPSPITCQILTNEQTVYIEVMPRRRPQFGNKPWVRTTSTGLLPIHGFGKQGFDPSSFASIHRLHKLGSETVRGVPTTTYRGVITIDKSQLTNDNPTLTTSIPDEVPIELWVSSDGLIRKTQSSYTANIGTQSFTSTMTFEYYDFGVPVHITAPPASQVANGNPRSAFSACVR